MAASSPARSSSSDGESAGTRPIGMTFVVAVDVLFAGFGSDEAELTVAVLETLVVVGFVLTTRVKVVLAPVTSVAIEQFTVPVQKTDGVVHAKAGPLWPSEMNVVPAGIASVSDTVVASLGPLFTTTMV